MCLFLYLHSLSASEKQAMPRLHSWNVPTLPNCLSCWVWGVSVGCLGSVHLWKMWWPGWNQRYRDWFQRTKYNTWVSWRCWLIFDRPGLIWLSCSRAPQQCDRNVCTSGATAQFPIFLVHNWDASYNPNPIQTATATKTTHIFRPTWGSNPRLRVSCSTNWAS